MAVKVYVDVLFLTNLIFDYILLWASAAFVKKTPHPFKLLLGSFAGAILAIVAFFYAKNTAVIIFFQLFTSSVMIILVFGAKDFFGCVRMSAVLFVTTFTLGGACLALVKSDGVVVSGGAFYVDISIPFLFAAGIITYILSSISYGVVLKKREEFGQKHEIIIECGAEKITASGIVDTGNTAKDESGRGIIFASRKMFSDTVTDESFLGRICVNTVGGEAELESFVPEKIYLKEKSGTEQKRKIAFMKEGILKDGEIILPNDFFDYI